MITLTTDFGLKDPYVAEMKGAILTIKPDAKIIDITHLVPKYDIRTGAFMLASSADYFPKRTVHVGVVDPGVGTQRRAIVVETNRGFFVGPDNGILILAAQKQGIRGVWELVNTKFMLPQVSSTFHGRDIFAPAAASIDDGVAPEKFGPQVTDAVTPQFAQPKQRNGTTVGEVLTIDDFGNIITNITVEERAIEAARVKLKTENFKLSFAATYADAKSSEPIAIVGSHGFLEIALNQASAAKKFCVKTGDAVEFTPL